MAKDIMQGDVEDLLREAGKVVPLAILKDDPRIAAYGRQLATMLLTKRVPSGKKLYDHP